MPLFNSQFGWRGIGGTVVVELLILLALAFAVVGYVEWSSDAAVTNLWARPSRRRLIRTIPVNRRFSPSMGARVAP